VYNPNVVASDEFVDFWPWSEQNVRLFKKKKGIKRRKVESPKFIVDGQAWRAFWKECEVVKERVWIQQVER